MSKKKPVIELPEDVLENIVGSLRTREYVKVRGLGIFETRAVKARRGRNPRTGKEITIPAYTKVRFRPTQSLKELFL